MKTQRYLMVALLFILSFFFLVGCELVTTPPSQPTVHLLLVALDYKNVNANSVKALEGTLVDAVEFGAALSSRGAAMGITVETMAMFQQGEGLNDTSYYPTKDNIFTQIDAYQSSMAPNDLFILYYSGHGQDFSGNLVTAKPTASGPEYELLSPRELYEAISELPGTKLVLLDSCYSGQHITPYPDEFVSWFTPLDSYDGSLFFLTAANDKQKSYEADFGTGENLHKHGYFTFSFLEALGWEHFTANTYTFSPTYGDAGRSYDYRGQMRSDNHVPAQKGSTIPLSRIMKYIKIQVKNASNLFSKQNVSTTMGPRDLILFDSRW